MNLATRKPTGDGIIMSNGLESCAVVTGASGDAPTAYATTEQSSAISGQLFATTGQTRAPAGLSLIHISEPTRPY